ncbi:MAG: PEPxxWA-CTERM sorting domain-containing protein [Phenylobacterium sp.]|uniref:PEPxxWA-CTERM sorting domain-containing protein n=1 Tax=Phenylobacterium sp. TaxID=1871053 RepID=UPI001A628BD3|nr:PEPxxWA-CTERM sorting domain-containing protein [Phenylobacterium sp.]MBL8771217.1 PEPxxWA-CTERM sorting domain-containing protein [Phenylobacterium sp.]
MPQVHKTLPALAAVAAIGLAAAPAGAATTLNVDWNEGCGATNCFRDGRYTHSWSASNATGPVSIGRLLLDRGILGDLDGQVFRLSFQLNGEELGSWGSFTMAGIGGDELNFWGQNFTWNPQDGDLVLVLEIVPPAKPGVGGRSGFASAPLEFGEGPGGDGFEGGSFDDGNFEDPPPGRGGEPLPTPTGAVPEPATWLLMIGGFGLAGAALRRRRAAVAA